MGIIDLLFGSDENSHSKFQIGQHVRVRYSGLEGSIIDVNGNTYMVSLKDGGKIESYFEWDLESAF